ncbi:hypothetical protein AYM40_20005 [Paraburkholderia phytofirmans OLGA172]|uniref:Uncharacterized protein n=1 Tax=Paraburkholderia phytofirmans OLGA172 TaxID=1417228 RepID=A0A160FP55_9BURK|nr:hypothetical protein AYM40_20005 [Paraburkholderia phytofirmans OLGA172]
MPSAQPARFARRHLHSVRADPATLTRAFAAPLVEPGGAASLLAVSVETGVAMPIASRRVQPFNRSTRLARRRPMRTMPAARVYLLHVCSNHPSRHE